MNIAEIIVVGLVIGLIARLLVPGRQPAGLLPTIAIGIAGSLLGWWIGRQLVGAAVYGHPYLWAIAGSVLLIVVLGAVTRGSYGRRTPL